MRVRAAVQTYQVIRTTQVDAYDEPLTPDGARAAPQAMRAKGDSFTGSKRKAAKISISKAKLESFDDLKKLIDTLPEESAMADHHPKITSDPASRRVAEEERNVRVTAWLYAASRESDNDFHLILGRKPGKSEMYMTMEVSGLPPASSAHRAKIEKVRNTYKNRFDEALPGSGYDFYKPPIPVEIGGSLYFDIPHLHGGHPGPEDLRDDIPTIWEVHPVTHLKFEPHA